MILALFDLDNTLLAGDSDFEWAQFLIDRGVLDREVYEARNQQFYDQYKAGTLDIHEFLDFQLKPLSRHPRSVLMNGMPITCATASCRWFATPPARWWRVIRVKHGC